MCSFWCCFWSQTGYFTSTPQERQACLKRPSWFIAGLCNTVFKTPTKRHLYDCLTLFARAVSTGTIASLHLDITPSVCGQMMLFTAACRSITPQVCLQYTNTIFSVLFSAYRSLKIPWLTFILVVSTRAPFPNSILNHCH